MSNDNYKDKVVGAKVKAEAKTSLVFLLENYEKAKHCIICFFEGEDDRYYYTSQFNIIDRKVVCIPHCCGGKEQVLKARDTVNNYIQKTAKKIHVAFFIDKDFDENNFVDYPLTPLFVTPCYAIENLYVTISCFKKILNNHFGIHQIHKDYNTILNDFEIAINVFHEHIFTFNVWYACIKHYSNIKKITFTKPIRKDEKKLFDELFDFANFQLICKIDYDFDFLNKRYNNSFTFETEIVEQKKSILKNEFNNFRGKNEAVFLSKFILLLYNKKLYQTSICVSQTCYDNIPEFYSHEADLADGLEDFFNTVKPISEQSNKETDF